MSLVLSTTAGKSHLVHLIDTPGHVNFLDEVAASMRLVDGVVLVVDVVEGVSVFAQYKGLTLMVCTAHGLCREHHPSRHSGGH